MLLIGVSTVCAGKCKQSVRTDKRRLIFSVTSIEQDIIACLAIRWKNSTIAPSLFPFCITSLVQIHRSHQNSFYLCVWIPRRIRAKHSFPWLHSKITTSDRELKPLAKSSRELSQWGEYGKALHQVQWSKALADIYSVSNASKRFWICSQ